MGEKEDRTGSQIKREHRVGTELRHVGNTFRFKELVFTAP
jgi:hypothetical protein